MKTEKTYEIERWFLVDPANVPSDIASMPSEQMSQCYLPDTGGWSIRARKITNPTGTRFLMTMKRSEEEGLHEIENEIDERTYLQMRLAAGNDLRKARTTIAWGDGIFIELDRFEDDLLDGMLKAEVELPSDCHPIDIPAWFGQEVTGQHRYSNHHLFSLLGTGNE